ncbi:MAG: HYR domain-containing protein, partial [bacterium]
MSNRLGSTGFVLLLIGVLVFATGSSALAQQDRVILNCPVVVTPPSVNTAVPVEVHYTVGTVNVGGFSLGFHYDSDVIEIDSMSKIGTDLPQPFFFTPVAINTDLNTILVGYADFTGVLPMPPGDSGLAFTLWFTVPGGTDNHCVDIDSMFVPPAGNFIFSRQTGGSIVPEWVDCGTADIQIGTCEVNDPPTAICQNVTVSADANCEAAVAAAAVDNGSFDTDGTIANMSLNPAGPYPLGATPVTLTVTDDLGATDECQATITVEDNTNPELTCPGNITVSTDAGLCEAVVNFAASATDNCDESVTIAYSQNPGTAFPKGTTTVNVTAT